jgi:hypothetical protein
MMFRKLHSQPRIKGIKREFKVTGLHPYVEEGIRSIAHFEGKTTSWVIAEIVSDFFGVDAVTGKIESIEKLMRKR